MEKLTKKNSIIYNQLWITKAIEEGHIDFLPVHKLPGKSIGEHIEMRYNQLYNNEFTKYRNYDSLDDYYRLLSESPKVTKKESLLFTREWIRKFEEEGRYVPNRRLCQNYSLGEILELKYYEMIVLKEDVESIFRIEGEKYTKEGYTFEASGSSYSRKKVK